MKSLKTQKESTENSCDHLSELPDDLILNILNRIHEARFMCWLLLISKRFFSLIPNAKIQDLSFRLNKPVGRTNYKSKPLKSLNDPFVFSLAPSIRILMGKETDRDMLSIDLASRGSSDTMFLNDFFFRKVSDSKFLMPHFTFITNVNVKIPMERHNIRHYTLLKWKAECWKRSSFSVLVMLAGHVASLRAEEGENPLQRDELPINDMAAWNIVFDTDLRIRYEVVKKFLRWFPNICHARVTDHRNAGDLIVREDWFKGMRNGEIVEDDFEFSTQQVHEQVLALPEYGCAMKEVRLFLYKLNGEDLDDDSIVSKAFEGFFSKAVDVLWTEGVICKTMEPVI